MKLNLKRALILALLAVAVGTMAFCIACTVDDDTHSSVPTHPGDPGGDFDPPVIRAGDPSINPSTMTVTVPPGYGGGDSFYFYVASGKAPYYWDHSAPAFGRLSPLDEFGDGIYRKLRYTLNAVTWTGADTIYLRDGSGKTAMATVTIALGTEIPPSTLTIIPTTVSFTNAVLKIPPAAKDSVVFTATGGVPPYSWFNAMTGNAHIVPSSAIRATYFLDIPFAGSDTVIVRDSAGKTATAAVTVTLAP